MRRAAELDATPADELESLPLAGITVIAKELFSVAGMPDSCGSRLEIPETHGSEGPLLGQLRQAGCVLLGKSVSTEFAFGQYNLDRQMPINPRDSETSRVTGGSSAGSAAAQAAGYCNFALGTDTGGSVRAPAALCGVAGYMPTTGLWSMDGVFRLSESFDTPGFFANTVADLAMIHASLAGAEIAVDVTPGSLRLGIPDEVFFAELDTDVGTGMDSCLQILQAAGVELVPFSFPDLAEVDQYYAQNLPRELVARLGNEFLAANDNLLDSYTKRRLQLAANSSVSAVSEDVLEELQVLARTALEKAGLDGWLAPTVPVTAAPQGTLTDPQRVVDWQRLVSRNTRPVNVLNMCACNIPLPGTGRLPVGLQLAAPAGFDSRLLAIAAELERLLSPV